MARDPETIEREIEQAREALAATLDQLGQRASPKRIMESGKATVRSRLEDPRVRYSLIAVAMLIAVLMVRRIFR